MPLLPESAADIQHLIEELKVEFYSHRLAWKTTSSVIMAPAKLQGQKIVPEEDMPNSLKDNPASNKYYFLPRILGLIGIFAQNEQPEGQDPIPSSYL